MVSIKYKDNLWKLSKFNNEKDKKAFPPPKKKKKSFFGIKTDKF